MICLVHTWVVEKYHVYCTTPIETVVAAVGSLHCCAMTGGACHHSTKGCPLAPENQTSQPHLCRVNVLETEEVNQANGWEVAVHVDAASGGFIAPFLYPDLQWDFRLPNVKSINVSGHK